MNKLLFTFILTVLIFMQSLFAQDYCTSDKYCGQSIQKNGIAIISLKGSYYDMGKQYGALERNYIQSFYADLTRLINFNSLKNRVVMDALSMTLPERNREIIQGMAQTSGLSYRQLLEITLSTDFVFIGADKPFTGIGCSTVEAGPMYTARGYGTLTARNYDVPKYAFNSYKNYTAITAFHPINGDNQVITISYIGSINAMSEINNKGLISEINNGMLSVPGVSINKPDTLVNNFNSLFQASSISDYNKYVKNHYPAAATNTGLASNNVVQHYERTSHQYKIATKSPSESLDIFTNTFIDSGFKGQKYTYGPGHDSPSLTFEREDNLKSSLTHLYGLININTLENIMTKQIPNGGALAPPNNNYSIDATLFSSVYDIQNSKLYLYIPTVTKHWLTINTRKMFNSAQGAQNG